MPKEKKKEKAKKAKDLSSLRAANKPEYVTGTGQEMWHVHAKELCQGRLCAIHNPTTEKPECDWPTHWRSDRGIMERICPCGIGHIAPEHMAFLEEQDEKNGTDNARWEGIHGCCGGHYEGFPGHEITT